MWHFNYLLKSLEIFSFSPVFSCSILLLYYICFSIKVVESKDRVTEQQMEMYGESALRSKDTSNKVSVTGGEGRCNASWAEAGSRSWAGESGEEAEE